MKLAVCCIVPYTDGADGIFLAVSRKEDHSKFGLGGGKVDPGESLTEAALREAREETGLDLCNLIEVYSAPVYATDPTGEDFQCICYFASRDQKQVPFTKENIKVEWVNEEKLYGPPFGEFNKAAINSARKLGLLK